MQQSALRSLAIVCDYMEITLFAIVYDLRFAIRDRLPAIVCDQMETSLKNDTQCKGRTNGRETLHDDLNND